jgi:NAD-dependent dihydropyrimidine dehydrogenase PreA subunit
MMKNVHNYFKYGNKQDCCGCTSCILKCPKKCISLKEDEQGFLYPCVDENVCIDCGLCSKVCPVTKPFDERLPINVFAAKHKDDSIRMLSSSGGLFTALAEKIILEGGVVFGAKFAKDWSVEHGYTDCIEGLNEFRGSKYVQSRMGNAYSDVEKFLKEGKKVLFTGTSCQISGLKRYLIKDYGDSLITVDVVCHGVPSPLVWKKYLESLLQPTVAAAGKNTVFSSLKTSPVLTGVFFRDKRNGWEKYGFSVRANVASKGDKNSVFSPGTSLNDVELFYEPTIENRYMNLFLRDLCIRPSCYFCSAKKGRSNSDITIADFWGIRSFSPEFYDEKGVSLALVYTKKGLETFNELPILSNEMTYEQALNGNPSIEKSKEMPYQATKFWDKFKENGIDCAGLILHQMEPSLVDRIKQKIKRLM